MREEKEPLIEVIDVCKDFKVGKSIERVLNNINLKIYDGEFVIIFGHSGSGKSTLLNTIMGLEPPTKGTVKFRGRDIYRLNEDELAEYRRQYIGIVSQQPNWLKSLNIMENVAYPLMISGENRKEAYKQARRKLKDLDLEHFCKYTPTELSGGEQQKATIARALTTNPEIILADEPTGNLDSVSGEKVLNIFKDINTNSKRTILMVSHNPNYYVYASKLVYMADDEIQKIVDNSKRKEV